MNEFDEVNHKTMRKRSQGYHARSFEEYFQKIDQHDTEVDKTKGKRTLYQRSKSDQLQFIQTVDDYILESSPTQNIEEFIKDKLNSQIDEKSGEDQNTSSDDDDDDDDDDDEDDDQENDNTQGNKKDGDNGQNDSGDDGNKIREKSKSKSKNKGKNKHKKEEDLGPSSQDELKESSQTQVKENRQVKLKLMIIGSEKVGKSVLLQNLFKDAHDSDSPEKKPSPTNEECLQNKLGSQEQSLDFTVKKIFNTQMDRIESYHIWIQNLSNDKNISIVESCYYGSCDVFVFLYSYQVKESLQNLIKCYEKVKQIRKKRIYSILVGMGPYEDEEMHKQAQDFAENCTFFINVDDKAFSSDEQISKIMNRIQNFTQLQAEQGY